MIAKFFSIQDLAALPTPFCPGMLGEPLPWLGLSRIYLAVPLISAQLEQQQVCAVGAGREPIQSHRSEAAAVAPLQLGRQLRVRAVT
jgi:hypothetical protein